MEYALRLGADERAIIAARAAAAGVSMAHYIRHAALRDADRATAMSWHDAAVLIREMTRVGVSLNQLARAQSSNAMVSDVDLGAVITELRRALMTVADLRTK